MGLFTGINTTASGMTAEQLRMDVIANNIANINTTRTPQGGPYKRQRVIFVPRGERQKFYLPFQTKKIADQVGSGVRVLRIEEDNSPPRIEYNPNHPDADENGYVKFPNINIVSEMVDMITATRAYEANVTALMSIREAMMRAIQIGER